MDKIFYSGDQAFNGIIRSLVVLLIVSAVLLPFHPVPVVAASTYLFHPGSGTATIDGNVDPAEWASADSYSQLMSGGGSLTGILYVMQDNTNLYLGFVIDDDELTTGDWYGILGDTLEIFFDDNNSGSLYEVDENKVIINTVDPWYHDSHMTNTSGSSEEDIEQNGEGRLTRQGNYNHFELSFPLCSGDNYDFCLSPGDIVGLQLQYSDYEVETQEPSPSPESSSLPGSEDTALVTIEIRSGFDIFLPLILK